jgi:hypothetical protein
VEVVLRRRRKDAPSEEESKRLAVFYAERVAEQDVAHPGYARAWDAFARVVLEHGGQHVVPPRKPDILIEMFTTQATLIDSSVIERRPGEVSDCHRNAAGLWVLGDCPAIGTGYALSEDGLWREHSWGIRDDGTVIETTVQRTAYFGVIFRDADARWFADWVLDNGPQLVE